MNCKKCSNTFLQGGGCVHTKSARIGNIGSDQIVGIAVEEDGALETCSEPVEESFGGCIEIPHVAVHKLDADAVGAFLVKQLRWYASEWTHSKHNNFSGSESVQPLQKI